MNDQLDAALPNQQIIADLRETIAEELGHIQLEERSIQIPDGEPCVIVAKSFHMYRFSIGMGDHFRFLSPLVE